MDRRKVGVGLAALLAAGVFVWAVAGPSPAPAQREGAQAKAGRYQYVSSLFTIVKVDTKSDKTYSLMPPMVGGPRDFEQAELAWVPVRQFEEIEGYRRWLRERIEAMRRERDREKKIDFKEKADGPVRDKEKFEEFKEKKFDRPKDRDGFEKKADVPKDERKFKDK
ncbi:MAG: hypothetical protein L0Z62_13420 [Gemmataceae bacterium]|nr:hypothetical protein [Gemmataceae bacterium]